MDEVSLYKNIINSIQLDNVDTPNLSRIKEISKRIYFAAITTENKFLIIKEVFITKQR